MEGMRIVEANGRWGELGFHEGRIPQPPPKRKTIVTVGAPTRLCKATTLLWRRNYHPPLMEQEAGEFARRKSFVRESNRRDVFARVEPANEPLASTTLTTQTLTSPTHALSTARGATLQIVKEEPNTSSSIENDLSVDFEEYSAALIHDDTSSQMVERSVRHSQNMFSGSSHAILLRM